MALILDDECFKDLFSEYSSENFVKFENEVNIITYQPLQKKHVEKGGIMQYIIRNIDKLIKMKLANNDITIDSLLKLIPNYVMLLTIKNNFNYIDIWFINNSIEITDEYYFKINLYLLKNYKGLF